MPTPTQPSGGQEQIKDYLFVDMPIEKPKQKNSKIPIG